MTELEKIEYDQSITRLRSAIDEATFLASWQEGRAMNLEKAIHFALA